MTFREAREISAHLRSSRLRLAYFPHRYATWLLGRVAAGASLRALKQSPLHRLLDNPLVRRIYYHTHEDGIRRKGIFHGEPPRSIYTKLPRRFGLELTPQAPAFLHPPRGRRTRHGAGADGLKWYRLVL